MRKPEAAQALPEVLQFNPRWWWDPVPWWIIQELDKNVLTQLATIHLQLQKDILAAQTKSIDASMKVLSQQRG
ncbi:hypothetical protein [Limobrevibacterium gyesilva]|uniref:Uncharacterized protein n=1 Tax=Limobrevibacterium gyesilva TaxID=2991712 RepID=A0AA41YPZ8_9PROT|nr:hypothetical protein [Limobrevibacterium gyesilva]MCW3473412.1 hypothetical protein [Limobrevibacterium gyesilva]